MSWLTNAARAALIAATAALGVALAPGIANADPDWFPPAPEGYEWEDYCGIDQLLRHGTWCVHALVRIP